MGLRISRRRETQLWRLGAVTPIQGMIRILLSTSRTLLGKLIMVADCQGNVGCEKKKRENVFADLLLFFYGHYRNHLFLLIFSLFGYYF